VAVLAETAVLQSGRDEVTKLYGRLVPDGWLKWVETLLAEYTRQNRREPFHAEDTNALLTAFYQQRIRLRADRTRQGVWRGPQFLKMDKQPFDILARLIKLDGKPSSDELTRLAGGSKTNLNTIVSRIREVVEPLSGEKIYIQNRRDVGYWLENGRGQ
jgi:DNA-binding response OmpR family regulator